jgi:hypothetical protein
MPAFGQGQFPTVQMVNLAKTPLGVDLAVLTVTLQKFLDTIFVPVWGYPAKLVATKKNIEGSWGMVFLDTADQAGTLGYHDLTKDGQPISKVFVKATLAGGEKISVTACHELCEMLIDPSANLWAMGPDRLYAYEMCDACEEEEFLVDGVPMSDFVHPAFFEAWSHPAGTKFDHLGKITKPFQTLHGGYQLTAKGGGYGQVRAVFGSPEKKKRFQREDRRLHRSDYRRLRS